MAKWRKSGQQLGTAEDEQLTELDELGKCAEDGNVSTISTHVSEVQPITQHAISKA